MKYLAWFDISICRGLVAVSRLILEPLRTPQQRTHHLEFKFGKYGDPQIRKIWRSPNPEQRGKYELNDNQNTVE